MNPLVSIVTVTFNSATTLEETIKSVVSQSYKPIQYVIVDSASTDGTDLIVSKYGKYIDSFTSEKDKGIYDGFNKGLERCKGRYIQFVNSDDIIPHDKIEFCMAYMRENPRTDILCGDLRMFREHPEDFYEHRKGENPSWQNRFKMGSVYHPTFFVKARVYNDVKFESYSIGTDFDWTVRAKKRGYEFDVAHQNLAYMRDGGVSSSDHQRAAKEDLEIAIKNNTNRLLVYLHYFWIRTKKLISNFLEKILPQKFLYIFKKNKRLISK
jgi:glycosyltransferase involved in cell wall biosynthesis